MNPSYHVLARTCRPQRFCDVVGQEAVVTTLKNALKKNRVGQVYLFSGSHGTGKTSLARLLAKALNCAHPTEDGEPCNACPSCVDIAKGQALDCLEIDGASHRGVEDVRQINEAIHFLPSRGAWKIYLIDEVHMLTKEAFNALLKTLEEPPAHVKFFFCTTESHRLPPTILSRCQHFMLRRLTEEEILQNLQHILQNQGRPLPDSDEGLKRIARSAEGSLREAQSLFEQILTFGDGDVSDATVREVLGIPSAALFSQLDQAKGHPEWAFDIVKELYTTGKPFAPFLQELASHFRMHLRTPPSLPIYRREQILDILEVVQKSWADLKHAPSERAHVEMTLVHIIRSHDRLNPQELLIELHRLRNAPPSPSTVTLVHEPEQQIPSADTGCASTVSIEKQQAPSPVDRDTLMRFAAKELNGTLQIVTPSKKI